MFLRESRYLPEVPGQSSARISQSSVAVNFGAAAPELLAPAAVRPGRGEINVAVPTRSALRPAGVHLLQPPERHVQLINERRSRWKQICPQIKSPETRGADGDADGGATRRRE